MLEGQSQACKINEPKRDRREDQSSGVWGVGADASLDEMMRLHNGRKGVPCPHQVGGIKDYGGIGEMYQLGGLGVPLRPGSLRL